MSSAAISEAIAELGLLYVDDHETDDPGSEISLG